MYYLSDVFNRLFDDFFRSGCFNLRDVNVQKTSSNGFPTHPVSNLYLNEKGTAVFEFAAPGFGKDDVTVEVEDNRLIVEGKNPDNDSNFPQNDATEEVEGRKYIHRNIAKRSFKNVYKVPAKVVTYILPPSATGADIISASIHLCHNISPVLRSNAASTWESPAYKL